jgi:hypothetical protein
MTDTASSPTTQLLPPLPPLPAVFDLEHPFGFMDEHGSSWRLASTPSPSSDTLIELSCSSDRVLIDGESFRISGRCLLGPDSRVYPPQLEFVAPTQERPHRDPSQRVRNQAKQRLEAALASAQAAALFGKAILLPTLPVDARIRISDLTRIALAPREELEQVIAREEAWLAPGGREDRLSEKLAAEIAAIRPNSSRKRQRRAEKQAELDRRPYVRACRQERIELCRRRLAQLERET